MRPEFKQVKAVFLAAVEKSDLDERESYLREACGGDDAMRRQVENLLRRHEDAGSFLERPPLDEDLALADGGPAGSRTEYIGTKIGPYKLIQQLGEGGMGTVWVAEQTEPVKRRVALKVIKPGHDSAQVARRFEAERQAMALMDHSHIAKVLDAGATPAGRPYFVMELVKGVPITRYCDELNLPVRERLELFVPVCQAIQHAHGQGIVHRDIKPSNVLVCMEDGKAIPKIIDFGVAKALQTRLTSESLHTEIGQLIGTLEYMAPEQAELECARHRRACRRLCSGGVALRAFDRNDAAGEEPAAERGVCGVDSHDKGRRAAQAEHAVDAVAQFSGGRGGAAAERAGAAGQGRARRAGLDRDAVPGEGPHAALFERQRAG